LKKQTQFVPGRMGAKSFMKGDYGNKPAAGVEENKAKQSQSPAVGRKSGAADGQTLNSKS